MSNLPNEDKRPRAVINGMPQEEYNTWMFLADKEAGIKPYTYVIKQSDLTDFIQAYGDTRELEGRKAEVNTLNKKLDDVSSDEKATFTTLYLLERANELKDKTL